MFKREVLDNKSRADFTDIGFKRTRFPQLQDARPRDRKRTMSDKPEKKEVGAEAPAVAVEKAKGGLMTKTPVLLAGVMIIEAIVLVAGLKMFGGSPKQATGAELTEKGEVAGKGEKGGPADKKKLTEIHVVDDFRALNKANGHTYFFEITVVVLAKGDAADKIKTAIDDRGALIKDRLRTIIAESDPDKLGGGAEPGLETFRRQVKYQLDEIIGDGLIDEVLVPKCIFRSDY